MSETPESRRFPRDIAKSVTHAFRLRRSADRQDRGGEGSDIREKAHELLDAWRRGDIDEALRVAMYIEWVRTELMTDRLIGPRLEKLADLERANRKKEGVRLDQIASAIVDANGNITKAADALGISRQAINKRLAANPRWKLLIEHGLRE